MVLVPEFGWHVLNGWTFLAAYFLGLIATVATFPGEKRKKLFYEPSPPRGSPRWLILMGGRLCAVSFVILMLFTPLQMDTVFFAVGAALYLAGYAVVVISLLDYRRAPVGQPVLDGLYHWSRNPQWVGLVLVYAGSTMEVASWLHLGLLLGLVVAYHFQILTEEEACLAFYGEAYGVYMDRVPRYLRFG